MKGNNIKLSTHVKKLTKNRNFQTDHESWQLAGKEECCVSEVSYTRVGTLIVATIYL